MQIPHITNLRASAQTFFESTWRGKIVQVLVIISFFSLIYAIAFRHRKPEEPPSGSLEGRVSIQEEEFIKNYSSSFAKWLGEKIQSSQTWLEKAQGNPVQQMFALRALKQGISEFKEEAEKRVVLFKEHQVVTDEESAAFLKECGAVIVSGEASLTSCQKFNTCLTKLQDWESRFQATIKTKWLEQCKKFPQYDFKNLQQYLSYLGLSSVQDFSRILETNTEYLAKVGLVEIDDVDILQLRGLQPFIKKLTKLVCFSHLAADEATLRPLMEEEVKKCQTFLDAFKAVPIMGREGQALKENFEALQGLLTRLPNNLPQALVLLNDIEQKDIFRQQMQLKGYIHQQYHLKSWQTLNGMEITRLSSYAASFDISSQSALYQIDFILNPSA